MLLGDETEKNFLNTKGKLKDVDDEFLELLAYIEDTTDSFAASAQSPLIGEIHSKVKQVKASKEAEVEYMTLEERYREKKEEGLKEGLDIIKLHFKGVSNTEIAEQLKVKISHVEFVIEEFEKE